MEVDGMKRVLFKVIVPAVIIEVWMLTCYPVCNKAEGFDWFLYWIIAGCPFGIRRMCLWLIPKNFVISGSIGVLALNCIIGGLIVSAKYSCGFSNLLDSSIIVDERYLDYFTTIMEDRLWQLLAKPLFQWLNRSGLSMNVAKAA